MRIKRPLHSDHEIGHHGRRDPRQKPCRCREKINKQKAVRSVQFSSVRIIITSQAKSSQQRNEENDDRFDPARWSFLPVSPEQENASSQGSHVGYTQRGYLQCAIATPFNFPVSRFVFLRAFIPTRFNSPVSRYVLLSCLHSKFCSTQLLRCWPRSANKINIITSV